MRELRALQATLIAVFERSATAQVATPTLEYDEVLQRGEGAAGGAYRFFDERGELLALRSDMTIPIARLAATRFADAEPPLRFSYVGNAYRAVTPQRAQMRQFMHGGVELIGAPAPEGTAEVIEVLSAALDAVGLNRAVVGLGDADLYRQLLTELGSRTSTATRILDRLAEPQPGRARNGGRRGRRSRHANGRTLLRAARPARRGGGPRQAHELGGAAVERATQRLRATYDALAERGVADGSSSTSACSATSATTPARSSRSTTPPSATSSAAVAATTTCRAASAGNAGGRLRPLSGAGAPRPDGGGAAEEGGE